MKSKQRKTTKQTLTNETGTEQEGSTVATNPREMRPQTLLDAWCLQHPRYPLKFCFTKEREPINEYCGKISLSKSESKGVARRNLIEDITSRAIIVATDQLGKTRQECKWKSQVNNNGIRGILSVGCDF
ncbi:unnamed protein product [Brassica napus]|uniref:(rape) hypothetical protein n=1 Tax=Brassica napus TaxID=3708 RepID=A0A817A7L9_BRANA|nr:unnamed protein product [Brassica napus]